MKRIAMFALILALIPTLAFAGAPPEKVEAAPSWYKVGTVMTWGVDAHGQQYDFVVTLKKLDAEIEFDWEMTAPVNRKGSVRMTEIALLSATKQHNRFSAGPLTLADKTTVWVSQAVLKQYRAKLIEHDLDTGSGPKIFLPEEEDTSYKATIDGTETEFKLLHLKGENEHLWILDNLAAPVIFKMDLGWKIWLKSVKSK
ncbi:MAG: hypothetical protein ABIK09_13035 [Pseudomonadota bacterium]